MVLIFWHHWYWLLKKLWFFILTFEWEPWMISIVSCGLHWHFCWDPFWSTDHFWTAHRACMPWWAGKRDLNEGLAAVQGRGFWHFACLNKATNLLHLVPAAKPQSFYLRWVFLQSMSGGLCVLVTQVNCAKCKMATVIDMPFRMTLYLIWVGWTNFAYLYYKWFVSIDQRVACG